MLSSTAMPQKRGAERLTWIRRVLRRVDSAIPLALKVGLPALIMAGLATAMIGRQLDEVAHGRSPQDALLSLAVRGGAMAVVLVLILYFFVFRRTARLARVAKQLAEGDLDVRLPEG